MTPFESGPFERLWRGVFASSACILAFALIDLVAFRPRGDEAFWAYFAGGMAVCAGLYAAKKLRDVERLHSVVDGSRLRQAHEPSDLGDADE